MAFLGRRRGGRRRRGGKRGGGRTIACFVSELIANYQEYKPDLRFLNIFYKI
jgi:molybdenum-dependent DNA-binding transcriptional regulator ModE